VTTEDPQWEPPGPGQWYYSAEHLPGAVSTLFADLFLPVARGWATGAARYGLPSHDGRFGPVGRFLYFSPGADGPVDAAALGRTAEETLATERWRHDLRTWAEETRPAVVAANRALAAVDLAAVDDEVLAERLGEAAAHYQRWAPEHFALMPVQGIAGGALMVEAKEWGLDPAEVFEALAGEAASTSSADVLLGRVVAGLRAAGIDRVSDLEEVEAIGGDAAAALDELTLDFGWRSLGTDLTPTLAEQPEAIVAMINAAAATVGPRSRPDGSHLDALRRRLPEADRSRFDDLVSVARVAYGFNDDNTIVLFSMPLGLVRRVVLEVGRRLVERGRLDEASDAFEASVAELRAILAGAGPSADILAARRAERQAAAELTPPFAVGEPAPAAEPVELADATRRLGILYDAWWAAGGRAHDPERAAATVGSVAVRGRALLARDPVDALTRLEPGDVLVTDTTHAAWNVVFPLLAAVAVEHGGTMGHAAILARELGLTALVGVPGLLERVRDGDQVEVDPVAGTITVLDRSV
jgi:pyruvate,water dikinase